MVLSFHQLHGIPLSYIVRHNDVADRSPKPTFLDEYVATAPLVGEAFNNDQGAVLILLKALVTGHTEAETIVSSHERGQTGRAAIKELRRKFEGTGINAIARKHAQKDIETMFYAGEKPPHMTWSIFSTRLKDAYVQIDQIEGKTPPDSVYSNTYKLGKLMENVKADFLEATKAQIRVTLTGPTPYTFDQALEAFQATVLDKHPIRPDGQPLVRRHLRETNSGHVLVIKVVEVEEECMVEVVQAMEAVQGEEEITLTKNKLL